MKWLINKAFLTPSVEQLLGHQIDSWISKTVRMTLSKFFLTVVQILAVYHVKDEIIAVLQ